MAKLQVAIDLLTTEEALALAAKVAPYVDIIELGTPLIKNMGSAVITAMKKAHPDKLVFADLKTADAGELEADIAFKAGADLVTVMGAAGNATIIGAVKAAKAHGKGVVVDTIGYPDRVKRAQEVIELGVEFVELHAGLDEQWTAGYSIQVLIDEAARAGVPVSIAGGVNLSNITAVIKAGAQVAVAGAAIYGAADPAAAAKALREAIDAV
ncbi:MULTISPECIES: 3-hexulose-6-phosphate synthase [unclassified Mucilaginibacter]|uniref:3-hexulose-6-phosphate synthase n=1 Tax=unclassified Mucilaginibacter TaxID=2617802 RepID=UPI002AC95614|nr:MULTISPECIES: 3-hexulose-6-phosphate synthase [unclassified Mucilaginibacter]MEB0250191.1 orotidine 5'-phosphate decarboxylase [Mucilaginibacter sp. 5B2]MEB0261582.1 orotidine 5'-phosphate decarboxylase [Mucilaginibacter sp. 10I4]MEB0277165.1 orotidine 5'-phosphate decarboxylase [Mucilaginibacter sp. 10B2]MEB0300812.1 orotidine 5'-phosphate decarboxylase [Mucilaginibacter sp. 5C4]WPX25264.1 3-hexulose-6-phosphate synthase [Mucilaginibacter sp. 5C4]